MTTVALVFGDSEVNLTASISSPVWLVIEKKYGRVCLSGCLDEQALLLRIRTGLSGVIVDNPIALLFLHIPRRNE